MQTAPLYGLRPLPTPLPYRFLPNAYSHLKQDTRGQDRHPDVLGYGSLKREERGAMSNWGWARFIGVLAILVLGLGPGVMGGGSGLGLLASSAVFQIVNTAMLFLLVTIAYEWKAGQSS